MTQIPYGRQDITEEDIAAVEAVLRSDWLTQGPAVEKFEGLVTQYCSAKHGIAVNSGTSALHIACRALDLGPGDVMWTSPNTFVASANAALYCGAQVDFVDIDHRTYNMSASVLADKLAKARKSGKLPKIVMPVHFAGQSGDMRTIAELAKEYGFSVIEDASHAIGGSYLNKPIGSCDYSSIAVFSFHPVKIITTAEGGMAVTNDLKLAERMRLLRSHGTTRDPNRMTGLSDGAWYYQQIELGYNYRMTDLQAALGSSQMKRIGAFVSRRRELAQRYGEMLASMPVVLPWQSPDSQSAYHLYPIRLETTHNQRSRAEVFAHLRKAGIGVNVHYIPVHTQPYYREIGFRKGAFPEAERFYEGAVSLPMYFGLGNEDQEYVVNSLREILS
jgi:UDP-4-amino-4,6-dideoxy-N-acetyl-beta-L-altrosamine transaminase